VHILLASALLAVSCDGSLGDEARARQCRANMNTLSTDQAIFSSLNDRWASSIAELDSAAGRRQTLLCPETLRPYSMTLTDSGYVIECTTGGHGSISNGTSGLGAGSEDRLLRILTGGSFPLLRFDKGDEFPSGLEQWCAMEGIRGAGILCGVGMLSGTDLGVFDGTNYAHCIFEEACEVLSLQGNVAIRDGKPFAHVHASISGHDFQAHGGHLFTGVVAVTLEVVLCVFEKGLVRLPSEGSFRPLDSV